MNSRLVQLSSQFCAVFKREYEWECFEYTYIVSCPPIYGSVIFSKIWLHAFYLYVYLRNSHVKRRPFKWGKQLLRETQTTPQQLVKGMEAACFPPADAVLIDAVGSQCNTFLLSLQLTCHMSWSISSFLLLLFLSSNLEWVLPVEVQAFVFSLTAQTLKALSPNTFNLGVLSKKTHLVRVLGEGQVTGWGVVF